jgi:hypothetical protein
MERAVQVFVVASDGIPHSESERTLEAGGLDELAARTRVALHAEGYRVRCVSFTSTGLVAYVERSR